MWSCRPKTRFAAIFPDDFSSRFRLLTSLVLQKLTCTPRTLAAGVRTIKEGSQVPRAESAIKKSQCLRIAYAIKNGVTAGAVTL